MTSRGGDNVLTGLDVLAGKRFAPLRGMSVGLVCNPGSVDRTLRHAADLFHGARQVRLSALFGPEHGVRGDAQYMAAVGSGRDRRTGVRVHSLYGKSPASLRPTETMLQGLDALVFDIQDVGARYYTYQATMLFCMEAAARAGVAFVVLDRPNPIGGLAVEGPALRPGFESFCGVHDIAVRHGLTVGELAGLYQEERRLDLALTVVPCEGWRRKTAWRGTGLPWVFPSPNMPTADTALVYPGMCLLEGTNLSEGRGTTRPFELFGAPWLDADRLAEALAVRKAAGRPFPPGPLRPDLGQARRGPLPRRRDPRPRRGSVPPLPHGRGVRRGGARPEAGPFPVAYPGLRVRRRRPRLRPALRLRARAGGDRSRRGVARPPGGVGARGAGVPKAALPPPAVRVIPRGFSLAPFPGEDRVPALRITGTIGRRADTLSLDCAVEGNLSELAIPATASPAERKNRLWEETCLELFLAQTGRESYLELNLSPAGHWNAYRFSSYREGMREEEGIASLPFAVRVEPGALRLSLCLEIGKIAGRGQSIEAGICAVVRTASGGTSHWALAHAGPRPDFHRREGFALTLPP